MLPARLVDLHVHTCLSPCASLDMTPNRIVRRALEKGLSLIAVTDHNSAENVGVTMRLARDTDLCVLPGMEITSVEEAHLLALLPDEAAAASLQDLVYDRLIPGVNDEDLIGLQIVANERDEVERMNRRLLSGSTTLSVEEITAAVHERGGLAIACHIDRETFSLVGQLGFIPPDLPLDAVEISRRLSLSEARERFPEYGNRVFIGSSDAHAIDDLGANPTRMRLGEPLGLAEVKRALRGLEGRMVLE